MKNISEILENVKTVGIGGHIRPDGDCIGSCMALYLYIREYFPDIEADVYLEQPKPIFDYIDRMDEVKTEAEEEKEYDLFITCDVSALDRLAVAGKYFDTAKKTACIDHHVSNKGFADVNHVRGDVGSACEVLYGLLDADKIAVRAGHHCAQPLLQHLGVMSTARASIAFYNTEKDIDRFIKSVKEIRRRMGYGE